MRRISMKTLILALTAVFLLFGGITTAMVFWQIIPDVTGARRDEVLYQENFSLTLSEGEDIYLSLPGVDVIYTPYDGEELLASFDGFMPASWADREEKLILRRVGGRIEIRQETRPSFRIQIGPTGIPGLRGTLTIQAPQEYLWRAAQFDTSSGAIDLRGLLCEGTLSVNTFSGGVSLEDITSGDADIDLSSGRLTLANSSFASLRASSFSGKLEMRDVSLNGACNLDTSSGDIVLERIAAPSLSATAFSGSVQADDLTLEGDFTASTSSGKITARRLAARLAKMDTFSGAVILEEVTTQKIDAETSSGRVLLSLAQAADIQCDTFSGDVELSLPQDMGFSLDFGTFSGKFSFSGHPDVNLDNDVSFSSGPYPGGDMHRVNISTSSGNLTIARLGE